VCAIAPVARDTAPIALHAASRPMRERGSEPVISLYLASPGFRQGGTYTLATECRANGTGRSSRRATLLIVLAPQETRDAERGTCRVIVVLIVFIVVRLGRTARQIGHPLEQSAARTCRRSFAGCAPQDSTATTADIVLHRLVLVDQTVRIEQQF